jgi:hypothetical protein
MVEGGMGKHKEGQKSLDKVLVGPADTVLQAVDRLACIYLSR